MADEVSIVTQTESVSSVAPQEATITTELSASPSPQTETQTTETKTDAAPPIPEPLAPDLIARGGRWKLGEEQLRAVPREILEQMMAAADAEVMEGFARFGNPQQTTNQPTQQAPILKSPILQPATQASTQATIQEAFKPIELKYEEGDEDAPYAQHAKAINEGVTKNLNSLYSHVEAQLAPIVQAIQAIREFNDAQILDRHLGELGSEWEDVFGKGATVDMDPKSATAQARQNYYKGILKNFDLDAQLGRERNPSDAMLRARYQLFGQKISAIERSKREAKAVEVSKTLPPPTGATNGKAQSYGLRDSVNQAIREMTMAR